MKSSEGVFGVLPGHVPTIAQLQPGSVSVTYDSDEGEKVTRSCLLPLASCQAICERRLLPPLEASTGSEVGEKGGGESEEGEEGEEGEGEDALRLRLLARPLLA